MKRILSFLLILTVCLAASSSNTISAINSKQDQKKEKAKIILVSGIVTDEQGNRLKGVIIMSVIESETDIPFGTESGDNGKYNIRVKSDQTLIFSLNSYESQKICIKGRDEIDIVMKKLKN
ncbi:MAG: hypothetical protein CVU12_08810 [Bacteroidetes bacterium HGW-Bacteroidetes-7]|jgi:hypothetical protein|nr:MAG: hypothetical protein CVU12_08810 [Bacteroidetes bacterium HGW-Bacteroidetes-7]